MPNTNLHEFTRMNTNPEKSHSGLSSFVKIRVHSCQFVFRICAGAKTNQPRRREEREEQTRTKTIQCFASRLLRALRAFAVVPSSEPGVHRRFLFSGPRERVDIGAGGGF